jgi:hypothetical protein
MAEWQKRYLIARQKYLIATSGPKRMAYRPGDPTVELEARVEVTTAKAYLIEPVMGTKREVWLPKSQVVSMGEADPDGNRQFVVTEWWYQKAELGE